MPAAAKTAFASKNPATLAKSVGAGSYGGSSGIQQGGEVICPLHNSDGSQCHKKCVGNFAYRSICEHIRRAHPDNWIPKLPASPETFAKMVGQTPRLPSTTSYTPTPLQTHHNNVVRKPSTSSLNRKLNKLSKLDESDQTQNYLDTLSPPSSATEAPYSAPQQNFASRFPPPNQHVYGYADDASSDASDVADERELVYHGANGHPHTETETEDEDYPSPYSAHGANYYSIRRKRDSRWHELIEAATTRAVVENSPMLLSPPQTAQTLPSFCPNTPSGGSTVSENNETPRVQCNECHTLECVGASYICTECVSGFCKKCALAAGKRGICPDCGAFGAKFKPLKVVIRT